MSHLSNAKLELERLVPVDGGVKFGAIRLQSSSVVHCQRVPVLGGLLACIRLRHMFDFQAGRPDFWNDINIMYMRMRMKDDFYRV